MNALAPLATCVFGVALACTATVAQQQPSKAKALQARDAFLKTCAAQAHVGGGNVLSRPDGVDVFYRTFGDRDNPAVVYLHGGPGYNGFSFEATAAKLLAKNLFVVVTDQRGMGRSVKRGPRSTFGVEPTLADFEALRQHLGLKTWAAMGHSAGGPLAVRYFNAFPKSVRSVVVVDTSPVVELAFKHQVKLLSEASSVPKATREKIREFMASPAPAFGQLQQAYVAVGVRKAQRLIQFRTDADQQRLESIDETSGLLGCVRQEAVGALFADGLFGSHPKGVNVVLGQRGLAIAGDESQTIGPDGRRAVAKIWRPKETVTLKAGHHVYSDAPQAFADAVTTFLLAQAAQRR